MTYPEDFSGLGGNVRGFPSPGTLQDLERWTEDSFWLDLLSVTSPSSAERFRERSLAWEMQMKDEQAVRYTGQAFTKRMQPPEPGRNPSINRKSKVCLPQS